MSDKGQVDTDTANFVKGYAKRWRAKSLFQVLLHYRAARFMDAVHFSQQVHLFNQRVVCTMQEFARGVPLDKIDPRQTNPSSFGPLPLPVRKIPFRFDQIPYFDTVYMCDPVNPLQQVNATEDDEEPWDAPLQKNPSLTSYLMTYNAFKKEMAVQTNWDRVHESDAVYQQSYLRDPDAFRSASAIPSRNYSRNDVYTPDFMNRRDMASSNTFYNDYNNFRSDSRRPSYNPGSGGKRGSLKKRPAPTPPPPPSFNRNMDNNFSSQRDFRPPNPIQEMQMMSRRAGGGEVDNGDDPPFNFKAMLRKTNYSRPENNNVEYNSRQFDNYGGGLNKSGGYPPPRVTTTEYRSKDSGNDHNYNIKSGPAITNLNDTSATSFKEAGTYVEEEIAPGVTLAGYAINI